MDFEKICTIFTMQEPYYGILLSAMNRFPTRQTPTMGVRRSGNVFCLGYNPDFIADKDLPTMMCLLKHECIHIAFNVFTIFGDEAPNYSEKMLRNIAADMEANSYVDWSGAKGVNPVFAKDFGWENCLGTLEYYARLKKKNEERQQQMRQQREEKKSEEQQQSEQEEKKSMFKGLDEMEKKILMMNRMERKIVQQIAQELGIPEDRVKDHLKSARMKTRQNMISHGN